MKIMSGNEAAAPTPESQPADPSGTASPLSPVSPGKSTLENTPLIGSWFNFCARAAFEF